MPTITFKVDSQSVTRTIDNAIRELGPAKNFILRDAGAFYVQQARKYVHVITGRTKKSTKLVSVTGNQAIVESGWGAPFEEDRGDPHDFMTQAAADLQQEFPNIIKNRYSRVFGGEIFR